MLPSNLTVTGVLWDPDFQQAVYIAQSVEAKYPLEYKAVVSPLTEMEWVDYTEKMRLRCEERVTINTGDSTYNLPSFITLVADNWHLDVHKPESYFETKAVEAFRKYTKDSKHEFVFMDIAIGNAPPEQLLIELFTDITPKTAANFKNLCTGVKGKAADGTVLSYLNTLFHSIQSDSWIQGGDIVSQNGAGGIGADGELFADENFVVRHDRRGIVSMANKGVHTNGSQFFITLRPMPWMDQKYVAFGKVILGSSLLNALARVPTDRRVPQTPCRIVKCGIKDDV